MSIQNFCDVLTLIRKSPRTAKEICVVTELSRGTVDAYIGILRDEGNIRVGEWRPNPRGSASPVYFWQDEPHAKGDIDRSARSPIAVGNV